METGQERTEKQIAAGRLLIKGRGATANPQSRFLQRISEPTDDGWQRPVTGSLTGSKTGSVTRDDSVRKLEVLELLETDRPAPRTELFADSTVKLITTNRSPDIPFDQSINPYKGCEHGCSYCFARPTHAYLDLSPGLDFETKIFYKTNIEHRLFEELSRRNYRCSTIAMGTNTDPYQPAEKGKQITRRILQTLLEWNHPVSIVTKSQLILRDLDLLEALAAQNLVHVNVSVTTLSNALKTRLEPRTASPAARLKVIERLKDVGVPVGVMVAPVIPFVNDHEIEEIVDRSVAAGAEALGYILLRLPMEVAPLFSDWLKTHYPLKADRVLGAIRQTRGGKLYRAGWGRRMRGEGVMADLIGSRFRRALRNHDLDGAQLPELRTDLFEPPGYQQSLF